MFIIVIIIIMIVIIIIIIIIIIIDVYTIHWDFWLDLPEFYINIDILFLWIFYWSLLCRFLSSSSFILFYYNLMAIN